MISFVIPVYRSAESLQELHHRLTQTFAKEPGGFEIIFVEDCGGDHSWRVIQQLVDRDSRVRGIQLSRNFGQHAATICGFSQAKGDWIATLDDDLEHSPESLLNLYRKALEGHDLVYGIFPQRKHAAWRNATSGIARWIFKKAIPTMNYDYTSFRFIRGDLAREVQRFDSPFPFVDGYLSWLTNNYASVEVPHNSRNRGTSNYTLKKLITHTVNILVTFSDLPLRLASWIGLLTFLLGMVWLGVILLKYLLGGIVISGFPSIMAGILLFGGVQLLVLGIFGEYLGRINFKSSKKPLFLIAHTVGLDKKVRE